MENVDEHLRYIIKRYLENLLEEQVVQFSDDEGGREEEEEEEDLDFIDLYGSRRGATKKASKVTLPPISSFVRIGDRNKEIEEGKKMRGSTTTTAISSFAPSSLYDGDFEIQMEHAKQLDELFDRRVLWGGKAFLTEEFAKRCAEALKKIRTIFRSLHARDIHDDRYLRDCVFHANGPVRCIWSELVVGPMRTCYTSDFVTLESSVIEELLVPYMPIFGDLFSGLSLEQHEKRKLSPVDLPDAIFKRHGFMRIPGTTAESLPEIVKKDIVSWSNFYSARGIALGAAEDVFFIKKYDTSVLQGTGMEVVEKVIRYLIDVEEKNDSSRMSPIADNGLVVLFMLRTMYAVLMARDSWKRFYMFLEDTFPQDYLSHYGYVVHRNESFHRFIFGR